MGSVDQRAAKLLAIKFWEWFDPRRTRTGWLIRVGPGPGGRFFSWYLQSRDWQYFKGHFCSLKVTCFPSTALKRGLINVQILCIKYDITYCVPFFQGQLLRRFRKQDIECSLYTYLWHNVIQMRLTGDVVCLPAWTGVGILGIWMASLRCATFCVAPRVEAAWTFYRRCHKDGCNAPQVPCNAEILG